MRINKHGCEARGQYREHRGRNHGGDFARVNCRKQYTVCGILSSSSYRCIVLDTCTIVIQDMRRKPH